MKSIKITTLLGLLVLVTPIPVFGETEAADLRQLFPEQVGAFRRVAEPREPDPLKQQEIPDTSFSSGTVLAGVVEYSGSGRQRFLVEIALFHQDAEAYSAVTMFAARARAKNPLIELSTNYGTAGFLDGNQIIFFKGRHFVRIIGQANNSSALNECAHSLSDNLDKGEAEIPPLIKHLPNWERAQKDAVFLNRFSDVQQLVPGQSVLGVLQTGGDADAAFTDLGTGKVLIIEYNTPQLAKDNDERIVAKIHELWKLGQPAPIGYRRVGNYSVFVFDASDVETARQLIDQVKYEQVVQWLGDNPNILKDAERLYVQTTLGVFLAVLKASGFALVGCLGLGGLIGALLFNCRRAQQRGHEAFSDAGGMLRLNIDELTPQTDPARLLGPGVK